MDVSVFALGLLIGAGIGVIVCLMGTRKQSGRLAESSRLVDEATTVFNQAQEALRSGDIATWSRLRARHDAIAKRARSV
jgi:hypothetical protein